MKSTKAQHKLIIKGHSKGSGRHSFTSRHLAVCGGWVLLVSNYRVTRPTTNYMTMARDGSRIVHLATSQTPTNGQNMYVRSGSLDTRHVPTRTRSFCCVLTEIAAPMRRSDRWLVSHCSVATDPDYPTSTYPRGAQRSRGRLSPYFERAELKSVPTLRDGGTARVTLL